MLHGSPMADFLPYRYMLYRLSVDTNTLSHFSISFLP